MMTARGAGLDAVGLVGPLGEPNLDQLLDLGGGSGSAIRCQRRGAARAILPGVTELNVLGGQLEPCGIDPVTGFFRDGCCRTSRDDPGSHTICAVVTADFLRHQMGIGNDLSTPMPYYNFPGLVPGDRWCVTAVNWRRAHEDGAASLVVLASTHERALEFVPLAALREHAVDVPADPGSLTD